MLEAFFAGLTAKALLDAAGDTLGAAADLHGVRAGRLLRRMTDRFEAEPSDAPVFFLAIWRAAVRATHGCVQQVYEHTPVTDEVRGDTPSWDRFRKAHDGVRNTPGWGDAAQLPQALQDLLIQSLPQALRSPSEASDQPASVPAQTVWACYCDALRSAGLQDEPPAVIRDAFFDKRPESQVWPWSKHFALRLGEQLRDNVGFKAMFDAAQFAGIQTGIGRLVAEFDSAARALAELSAKFERLQDSVERIEHNTVELKQGQDAILVGQQQNHDALSAKLDLLLQQLPVIGLYEEIKLLRQRPDIRIEDLICWLRAALERIDPLPPEALPKLLQQALTVDLPKLRAEAERYRLDPLASPQAQALLDEIRLLLRPQAGTPLDLQEARDKLKALDDRVVAERKERRQREDRELAELRVLRADAERASANYAAAAELMEQAAGLFSDAEDIRFFNELAADNWCQHAILNPGLDALGSAIRLLTSLISTSQKDEVFARLSDKLGIVQSMYGKRLGGDAGIQSLRAAEASYDAALMVILREAMPEAWAAVHNNLAGMRVYLGEILDSEPGIEALFKAQINYHAALEVYKRETAPLDWAMIQHNLGYMQRLLGELLSGERRLNALRVAEVSCHAALEVRRREAMPVDWAKTQDNLGSVQRRLGEYLQGQEGIESLHAAIESYRAALEIFVLDSMPVDWALTQNNLGAVQFSLAGRLDGNAAVQALRAAEASYRAALKVFTRDKMPANWRITTDNLAIVENFMAEHGG